MALVPNHSFESSVEVGTQQCRACGVIRHLKQVGTTEWFDHDGSPLSPEVGAYLHRFCPGPVEKRTLRKHYKLSDLSR